MKSTHLILILVLIAAIVVGLVSINNKDEVLETIVNTELATTTNVVIPSPLTLASLQAMPGWNPTMEVEGMVRVEDGSPELSNNKLEEEKVQIMTLVSENKFLPVPSRFTIIHANSYYDYSPQNKNCRYYPSSGTTTPLRDCVNTPILDINELIIISDDTGEVLHKFKLEEGFSLAGFRWNMYEIKVVNFSYLDGDFILPIYIYKWENWNNEKPVDRQVYDLNLVTGEIR